MDEMFLSLSLSLRIAVRLKAGAADSGEYHITEYFKFSIRHLLPICHRMAKGEIPFSVQRFITFASPNTLVHTAIRFHV